MALETQAKFVCYDIKVMDAWNGKTADIPASSHIISFFMFQWVMNPCMNILWLTCLT